MEIYYSIRIFEIPIFACLENVLRFAAAQMMLAAAAAAAEAAAGKRRQHMGQRQNRRQII